MAILHYPGNWVDKTKVILLSSQPAQYHSFFNLLNRFEFLGKAAKLYEAMFSIKKKKKNKKQDGHRGKKIYNVRKRQQQRHFKEIR